MSKSRSKIWTSKLVHESLDKLERGLEPDLSCFWEGDTNWRAADINFELTDAELKEYVKCSKDVVYFADTFAFAMTDDGVANIKLREYQKNMLHTFQDNRFIVMLASRQIGKCLSFNSIVEINTEQGPFKIPIGLLYLNALSKNRNLTLLEKIKYKLWIYYSILTNKVKK